MKRYPPKKSFSRPSQPSVPSVPLDNKTPFPWVQLRTHTYQPFLYQRMILAVQQGVKAGDLVTIFSRQGEVFGYGYYHPWSLIGLRLCSYANEPIEDEWLFLRQRIEAAVFLREKVLHLQNQSEAYRLIHAEGDRLPGLILERYNHILVGELFSLAMYQRREKLTEILKEVTNASSVYWRADQKVQELERFQLEEVGPPQTSMNIRENGLRFRIDLQSGHKTGFFCDQRDNRLRLTRYTSGAEVLDICSYSGGFGIYAKALGNAKEATCVDLDENAVELGKQNANLNQLKLRFVHADSFSYLRQMKVNETQYDVVILDPPKFITDRDAFREGRQKYLDLNKLGISVVRPGGIFVTCSCSGLLSFNDFLDMVKQASHIENRKIQLLELSGPGPDHPVLLDWPESGYLKVAWCRIF